MIYLSYQNQVQSDGIIIMFDDCISDITGW